MDTCGFTRASSAADHDTVAHQDHFIELADLTVGKTLSVGGAMGDDGMDGMDLGELERCHGGDAGFLPWW